MSDVVTHDDLLNQSVTVRQKALDMLQKAGGAEHLVEVENLLKEAEDLAARSQKMLELKERAESGLPGRKPVGEDEKQHGNSNTKKDVKGWDGHFGNFLSAVKMAQSGRVDPRLKWSDSETPESERKDLAEGIGTTGGYLVPTEFLPDLMQQVSENAIIRPRANIIPMTRRTIEVPALKQDGTTVGEPHWFGGMLAFWSSEAETMKETEPAFRNIQLTAHELTAVTHTSNNLLADSAVSLAAILTGPRGFPGVVAWKEDYAFLRGTGVGQPLGILNSPATVHVTRKAANKINYEDLVNMMAASLPSGNFVWVANLALRADLMLMAGPSNGTDYLGTFLWGNAEAGIPDRLMGFPIIFTEKLPVRGQDGDIALIDASHYYVGDRQMTTVDSTDQARWLRNQTSWKVVHRVDGQPWLNLPFTLADGTTKVSPFVILDADVTP